MEGSCQGLGEGEMGNFCSIGIGFHFAKIKKFKRFVVQ